MALAVVCERGLGGAGAGVRGVGKRLAGHTSGGHARAREGRRARWVVIRGSGATRMGNAPQEHERRGAPVERQPRTASPASSRTLARDHVAFGRVAA